MSHHPTAAGAAVLVLILSAGCGEVEITNQLEEEVPLEVTRTDPAEAEQGETLEVRIFGDGFSEDADVAWERDGVLDDFITVHNVTYVSRTELVAAIRVAIDTELGLYDVAVTRKRKKGVGSEARAVAPDIFEVKEYTPIALGSALPFASAFGISDANIIVGAAVSPHVAVLWGGSGTVWFGSEPSRAVSINGDGYIAGSRAVTPGCGVYCHYVAFVYHHDSRQTTDLQPNGPEGTTWALAINDAGTVVGWAAEGTDYQRLGPRVPVVWPREATGRYAAPIVLATGGASNGEATGINAHGDVVGTLYHDGLNYQPGMRAVLWKVNEDGSYQQPVVLGGADAARANGINARGWIAGATSPGGAAVWLPDAYDTPVRPDQGAYKVSEALAISDDGHVVGWRDRTDRDSLGSDMCCEYWGSGVLWRLDRTGAPVATIDLAATSGHDRSTARAVNRHGWAAGYSWLGEGGFSYRRATLWRPDE